MSLGKQICSAWVSVGELTVDESSLEFCAALTNGVRTLRLKLSMVQELDE